MLRRCHLGPVAGCSLLPAGYAKWCCLHYSAAQSSPRLYYIAHWPGNQLHKYGHLQSSRQTYHQHTYDLMLVYNLYTIT